ncbi:EF-hand domain-containing protein [Rhodovulum marinum]|uniref:EF hand domain-containing protein n=1 Tax=Rhodovulum marinum TaxID=320662 RepID=A0A4R2PV82_9RHOB|nr:EF-hand domain-containing protein [Rhodovulum marinum]TCP39900.1 EF hand domain-containing protein [Rhodovulum marinum]
MPRLPAIAFVLAAIAGPASAQDTAGAFFMQVWDLDHDGTVTLAELERMRGNVFGRFDVNEDGALDAAEYAPFDAARIDEAEGFESAEIARMTRIADGLSLARNDADGDGRVTAEEFRAGAADWLAALDADGSGDIGPADFATD